MELVEKADGATLRNVCKRWSVEPDACVSLKDLVFGRALRFRLFEHGAFDDDDFESNGALGRQRRRAYEEMPLRCSDLHRIQPQQRRLLVSRPEVWSELTKMAKCLDWASVNSSPKRLVVSSCRDP